MRREHARAVVAQAADGFRHHHSEQVRRIGHATARTEIGENRRFIGKHNAASVVAAVEDVGVVFECRPLGVENRALPNPRFSLRAVGYEEIESRRLQFVVFLRLEGAIIVVSLSNPSLVCLSDPAARSDDKLRIKRHDFRLAGLGPRLVAARLNHLHPVAQVRAGSGKNALERGAGGRIGHKPAAEIESRQHGFAGELMFVFYEGPTAVLEQQIACYPADIAAGCRHRHALRKRSDDER